MYLNCIQRKENCPANCLLSGGGCLSEVSVNDAAASEI